MNKYLKGIFLSATLLIPILLFLFLKYFGENRFDIPIYYENGISSGFTNCTTYDSGQYYITNSGYSLPGLFIFLSSKDTQQTFGNVKQRVDEDVKGIKYNLYSSDSAFQHEGMHYLTEDRLIDKLRCEFISDTLNQFILVDNKRRIRGYYNMDREDVDRMIVEIKILLENERNSQ